ncbi:MAG: peroxidase family protein [Candidatus Peregrinibacteria bacterium]|nr:peroxidase family protein [Candidatus Peregrinibacteria bacterium]
MSLRTSAVVVLSSIALTLPSPLLAQEASAVAGYRTIDGWANNAANPTWGMAGARLSRRTPATYADGYAEPGVYGRPNARVISNTLAHQNSSIENRRDLTDMVPQWGQFLTHDIGLTPAHTPTESFVIPVPTGDPVLDPQATGTKVINVRRSVYDPSTGTGPGNPREQLNMVTSFIDASQVYGSDLHRANALRSFQGGKLRVSAGNLLPFNDVGLENELVGTNPAFFIAGDIRANEQLGLTSMHTLFVREHNRLCDEIAQQNPGLSDEELYQRARRIVIAQMQAITYNEFLPAILGPAPLRSYRGYNPTVNPSIDTVFSTTAFRFGHSNVSDLLLRLDNNGNVIPQGNLTRREASQQPQKLVTEGGIDPLLKGLSVQVMQETDLKVINAIRNILFGPPGSAGTDIFALDIQRGRDHGIMGYNALRQWYGLAPVASFQELTDDAAVAAQLQGLYGDVNSVDAFIGMLAERHVRGGSVGPLTRAIIAEQFEHLRNGDLYWYENALTFREISEIRRTKLSDIIRRNTGITNIQKNVFVAPAAQRRPAQLPPNFPGFGDLFPSSFFE